MTDPEAGPQTPEKAEETGDRKKKRRFRLRRRRSRARVLFIIIGAVFQTATPWTLAVGGGVLVMARLLQVWSYGHLDKSSRTNPYQPPTITTSGPYAFVRNPIMLGSSFSDMGYLLMAGNWVVLGAYIIIMMPVHAWRVLRVEEPHLLRSFGEPYAEYCKVVSRFVPRPLPWKGRQRYRWSFFLVLRNMELTRSWNFVFFGWVAVLISHVGTMPYPAHLSLAALGQALMTPWVIAVAATGVTSLVATGLQRWQKRRDAETGDPRVREELREKVGA